MKKYIIWTPSYSNRNAGVRALHLLADALESKGLEVFLYSSEPYSDKYKYVNHLTDELRAQAVVVYPELVHGNPLRCRNVVRYVMNYPGKLGGAKTYHASEKIITYLPEFYEGAQVLTIPLVDQSLFFDDQSPKTQDCYFVYKGGKCREAPETEGLLEINMRFPETRAELAKLLRSTGILYSYDDCSTLLDEAVLCGAKVKIITADGMKDHTSLFSEFVKNFPGQLDDFIAVTQAMNYAGELEDVRMSHLDAVKNQAKRFFYAHVKNDESKALKYRNRLRGF